MKIFPPVIHNAFPKTVRNFLTALEEGDFITKQFDKARKVDGSPKYPSVADFLRAEVKDMDPVCKVHYIYGLMGNDALSRPAIKVFKELYAEMLKAGHPDQDFSYLDIPGHVEMGERKRAILGVPIRMPKKDAAPVAPAATQADIGMEI